MALKPDTYCVKDSEDFSTSELSAVSHSTVPVIFFSHLASLLGACRQCPQPYCAFQKSCSWAELCLCHTAWLSWAPSIPVAQPSSAAEDQPKALLTLSPLGSLQVSLELQRNLLWNRLTESLMFPLSAEETHCFVVMSSLQTQTEWSPRFTFPCPTVRQWPGGISFTSALRERNSADSVETSHSVSVDLGLEGDSAPWDNPPGGGIPLASVQVCTKQAPAGELLVSAPRVINEDEGHEKSAQTQTPGNIWGASAAQDACWLLQALMEQCWETRHLLGSSPWRLVGNVFGQVKWQQVYTFMRTEPVTVAYV